MIKRFILRIAPQLHKYYTATMLILLLTVTMSGTAFAVDDMWTVANTIIVDVYNKVAGISLCWRDS